MEAILLWLLGVVGFGAFIALLVLFVAGLLNLEIIVAITKKDT